MIVTYAQKERINLLTSKETVKLIIDALEDKKAENIQIIDISEVSSVAYRHTGSAELLHHAFGSVGGSCMKQNPTLNFQSRLHRTSL